MRIFHSYHNKSPWMLIIGVIVILSAIFTIMSKKDQQNLNAYTKSDKVSQEDTDEDKEDDLDIDMSVYTDNKVGFSISVPSDWNQVTKDGYPTFISCCSARCLFSSMDSIACQGHPIKSGVYLPLICDWIYA